MYRATGLYLPTHRPLPVSEVEHARGAADNNPTAAGLTEPMVFVRLFLVVGFILAAAAVAASVS
ncbi:hypothetical protein [Mesorhizobium sp.]|uniref:hypothetical protein n=1 Tax=Mesorhizobium sp. TaxID=1871066 RepID=UPI0025CB86E1|nr:hypothetical protein [Mesorhizobium sp.]